LKELPANDVFSFGRRTNDKEILVGLNISGEPRLWDWEGCGERLLSSGLDCKQEKVAGQIDLKPNEGVIVKVTR
jgi:alpha-glucosidase